MKNLPKDENRFETTDLFWDCECKNDYIKHYSIKKCVNCGAEYDEMPNSRVPEVVERYPHLKNAVSAR